MAQDPAEITMWLDATRGSTTAECVVENAVDAYNALGNGTTVKATLQANNWDATRHVAGRRRRSRCRRHAWSVVCDAAGAGRAARRRSTTSPSSSVGMTGSPKGRSTSAWRMASSTASRRDRDARPLLQQDALRAERLGTAEDAGRADGAGRADRATPASSRSPTPTRSGGRPTSGSSASSSTTRRRTAEGLRRADR